MAMDLSSRKFPPNAREDWVRAIVQLATPVFESLAAQKLKEIMPVGQHIERRPFMYLEAFGRSLQGVAPWLAAPDTQGEEATQQAHLLDIARQGLDHATRDDSLDRMNFSKGSQAMFDAAHLAQGLLRGWDALWEPLDDRVKQQVISCMNETRVLRPAFNNALLFSATIDAFLARAGAPWDRQRIDYAIRQMEQWYLGDGLYSEGPSHHWDYYNSFVIHPMLLDVLDAMAHVTDEWNRFRAPMLRRTQRYGEVLERLIASDGTYPPVGRSIVYRFGAFQSLAHLAMRSELPETLSPAQVRCALSAVLDRLLQTGIYNEAGFLHRGLAGSQPFLAEEYVSSGSVYMFSLGFLPLGLSPSDPFWTDPPQWWTSAKIWAGEQVIQDHHLQDDERIPMGGWQ